METTTSKTPGEITAEILQIKTLETDKMKVEIGDNEQLEKLKFRTTQELTTDELKELIRIADENYLFLTLKRSGDGIRINYEPEI